MFPTVLKESDIHLVKSAAPIVTQTLVNISLWQRRELFCIVLYFKVQLKVFNIKRTSDPFIFASSLYVCFKFKQLLTSENNIKTHKKRESGYILNTRCLNMLYCISALQPEEFIVGDIIALKSR